MIAKIAFEKEIHLFRGQVDFKRLKAHCQTVFKAIPKNFEFYYIDSDGDKINLNSQQDLNAIYQSDDKPAIKKFFIQEYLHQFEELNDSSNPEQCQQLKPQIFCSLPNKYSNDIKTLNIVKDTLSKKEQAYIKKQSFMFLAELQREIVSKIVQQQEKIINEEVTKFVEFDLSQRIVQKVIREEEKIIKQSVAKQVNDIIQNFVTKLVGEEAAQKTETKQIGIQISNEMRLNNISRNEILIDRLVEEKLKKIMPNIIKQMVRTVESKLRLGDCMNCESKKQKCGNLMRKYERKYKEC